MCFSDIREMQVLLNDKEVMNFESSLDEFSGVFVLGVSYRPPINRLNLWFCHVLHSRFLADEDAAYWKCNCV